MWPFCLNFIINSRSELIPFYTTKLNKKIPSSRDEYSRHKRLTGLTRLRFESFRFWIHSRTTIYERKSSWWKKTQDKQSHSNSGDIIANPSRSSLLSFADLSLSLSLSFFSSFSRSKTQQVIIQTFERRERRPSPQKRKRKVVRRLFPFSSNFPEARSSPSLRVDCSIQHHLILSAIFVTRWGVSLISCAEKTCYARREFFVPKYAIFSQF